MIVLPDAENRIIVSSFLWTKHWNVKDGQTNRSASAMAVLRAMRTCCKSATLWVLTTQVTLTSEAVGVTKKLHFQCYINWHVNSLPVQKIPQQ